MYRIKYNFSTIKTKISIQWRTVKELYSEEIKIKVE